jgi:hypothetical protein
MKRLALIRKRIIRLQLLEVQLYYIIKYYNATLKLRVVKINLNFVTVCVSILISYCNPDKG